MNEIQKTKFIPLNLLSEEERQTIKDRWIKIKNMITSTC